MLTKLTALLNSKKKVTPYHCFLEWQNEGLAVAVMDLASKTVQQLRYIPYDEGESPEQALQKFIKSGHYAGGDCSIILRPTQYRLVFLDAPNLPESEWRQAVPWLCKDVISKPIDEVAIDIFPVPAKLSRHKKVFAVIADKAILMEMQTMVTQAGLALQEITIAELAYAPLLETVSAGQTTGLLFGQLKLMIFEENLVSYSRTVLDIEDESQMSSQTTNKLPLEIQSSFTFYQSSLSDQLPAFLYLTPTLWENSPFKNLLEENIFVPIKPLAAEIELPKDLTLNEQEKGHCLLVYGQALSWLKTQRVQTLHSQEEEVSDATKD